GQPGVGRTDVVNVAVIGRAAAGRVLAAARVVEANHVAVGRRFAPAHVSPNSGENRREVAAYSAPRPLARAGVDAAVPGHATVGRAVDFIDAGGQAAAAFVHRRHINIPTALQVAGDLDVTDEAGVELDAGPIGAVVGVGAEEGAAADGEIVVGDVH